MIPIRWHFRVPAAGTTSQSTRTGHPRWAASRARCQTQSQLLLWRQWIFLKSGKVVTSRDWGDGAEEIENNEDMEKFYKPSWASQAWTWLGDKWMVCGGKCQKSLPPSPSPPSPSLSEDIGNVLFFWLRSVASSARLSIGTCFVAFLSSFLLRPIALIIHCNHCNHHGYCDFKYHESWLFHFGFFTMTTTILDCNPTMPSCKWLQMAAGAVTCGTEGNKTL